MSTQALRRCLTAADLKDHLHDIQDNVVAPILMRYGRHIFVRFTDSAKSRTWLRKMFDRVNARQQEHGTRFTVNVGFTYEGLKALGLSQRSLDSFPAAFRIGMRGRAEAVGDVGPHAPEHWEGGLGGPDIHAMALLRTDSDRGREEAMRIFRAEMEATGGVEISFVQDTMALGCNFMSLGKDRVIAPTSSQTLIGQLKARGFEVAAVDMSEISKTGGGIHCMAQALKREPA